jgi:hypothetical protein
LIVAIYGIVRKRSVKFTDTNLGFGLEFRHISPGYASNYIWAIDEGD